MSENVNAQRSDEKNKSGDTFLQSNNWWSLTPPDTTDIPKKSGRELEHPASPLCTFCTRLLSLPSELNERYDVESPQTLAQLEESIGNLECHFCHLRWKYLSEEARMILGGNFTAKLRVVSDDVYPSIELIFQGDDQDEILMEYVLKPLDPDGKPNDFVQIPANMNSQTTYDLADWWIQDCRKNHARCNRDSSHMRRLPTRLVDLGTDDGIVRPRIQLSSDLDPSTLYMTLSHRWRETMPMLLIENLNSWSQELPFSILTQTFKDAMEVAKRLKIRYIWIDSLWIIQNSDTDWGKEASLMGDWYLNSYCNIIANARGRDGLFPTRNIFESNPCLIKSAFDSYNTTYRCYPYYLWETNVDSGMMFDRGWFVQEHVLPPRALYFCETSLFWECPTRTAVESVPTSISMTEDSKPTINFENSDRNYETWKKIIARYSRTNLTFASDKLIALSGLAKKVGIRGDYLAGLWKDYLDIDLLWSPMQEGQRSEKYRAPSWSWASIEGHVLTCPTSWRRDLRMVADVLETKVDLKREDPMGEVKGGALRLSCCLTVLTGMPASLGRRNLFNAEGIKDAFFSLDVASSSQKLEFHLALILSRPAWGGVDVPAVVGLLLEPTGRKGEFERRGRFTGHILKDAEGNPEKFQRWVEAFQNLESDLGFLKRAGDVDPVLGLPRYEITII